MIIYLKIFICKELHIVIIKIKLLLDDFKFASLIYIIIII